MKKTTRYKLKEAIEGAPEFFETLDAARQFLLAKKKDGIVRALETARYPGRMIEQFAPGGIRSSVEAMLEQQRRFPLDTANNLRGRLRRMKFNLYKRGAKGVSYVCAVKRSFRTPLTVLAEKSQKLITFIEQHPMVPITRLPQDFLGLPEPEKAEGKSQQVELKPQATPTAAPETPAAPVTEAAATPITGEVAPTAEAPVMAEPTTDGATTPAEPVDAKPAETEPAAPAAPEAAASPYTPEQQLQLRELLMNLRWLVSEGYVTEYGDGKLYAPPVLLPPKPKVAGEATPAGAEAGMLANEMHETVDDTGHDEEAAHSEEGDLAAFGDPLNLPASPEAPPAAGA
jgi:hypothetical protein